jgi:HEAT repeat protein
MRYIAARSLAIIGGENNIALLLPLLSDKEPENRLIGLMALKDSKDSRVVAQAKELLKDKFIPIRSRSAQLLGNTGDPSVIDPLSSAIKDMNIDVRVECMKSLTKFKDPRTIPALMFVISNSSKWVEAATRGELEQATSTAFGAILDTFQSGVDTVNTGRAVVPDLNKQANARAAKKNLEDAAADAAMTYYFLVKSPAEDGLAEIGAPGLDQFIKAASDNNSGIRCAAVKALGRIKAPEAFDVLAKAIEDRDKSVRRGVVFALYNSEDPRKTALLEKALKDKESSIRDAAERALAFTKISNSDNTADVSSLIKNLGDNDPKVVERAAWTLSKSEDPQVTQALRDAAGRGSLPVITGAYQFFVKTSSKDFDLMLITALKQRAEKDFMGTDGKPVTRTKFTGLSTKAMAKTYIQSGNLLLETEARSIAARWELNLD